MNTNELKNSDFASVFVDRFALAHRARTASGLTKTNRQWPHEDEQKDDDGVGAAGHDNEEEAEEANVQEKPRNDPAKGEVVTRRLKLESGGMGAYHRWLPREHSKYSPKRNSTSKGPRVGGGGL